MRGSVVMPVGHAFNLYEIAYVATITPKDRYTRRERRHLAGYRRWFKAALARLERTYVVSK